MHSHSESQPGDRKSRSAAECARSAKAPPQRAAQFDHRPAARALTQLVALTGKSASTPNLTGLPDTLKAGVEHLSGLSLDHVRVHRNSSKPAQLGAHAYAQGSEIHLGPGQEKHLSHEAWHVVQQTQGRVRPTDIHRGTPVNDDLALEREADAMGARAQAAARTPAASANRDDIQQFPKSSSIKGSPSAGPVAQLRPFETRRGTRNTDVGFEVLYHDVLPELLTQVDGNGMAHLYTAVTADLELHPDEKGTLLLEQIEACARATIEKLMEDPDIAKLRRLRVLSDQRIKFWLSIDYQKPPPDNLARGIIAECLSARAQRKKHPGSRVISGLVVAVPDASRPDGLRKLAEIDNLTVTDGEHGLVPLELVEAKAGSLGRGRLITQLSGKIKELRKVTAGKASLFKGTTNVTAKFDLSALDELKLSTATADEEADTPLSTDKIARLYEALVRLHTAGYESLRVLAI